MCMVIKRDGRKVQFNKQKITIAILKAIQNTDNIKLNYDESINLAESISNEIDYTKKELNVEEIQDKIIDSLRKNNYNIIADVYDSYRRKRTIIRERNSSIMVEIGEKLTAKNVQNQNANVDEHSFGGRRGEADSSLMRYYALNNIMNERSKWNHLNNRIYVHDLDSYPVGMSNCFQRNTPFITEYGIRTFESFKDGDKVKVIDKDGVWRDATVHFYGRQPMQQVTFERCGKTKIVNCTKDHRWILKDGTVTTNLSVGDRLYPLANMTEYKVGNQRDAEMFCFGLVLADGCDSKSNESSNTYLNIRLRGDKIKYGSLFESVYYYEYITSKNTSSLFYRKESVVGKQSFLTNKMWNLLSLRDKISLFNGYYAGDGRKSSNHDYIDTDDERVVEMISDISALAGYHIINITVSVEDTDYKKNRIIFHISLTKGTSDNTLWKVTNIKQQANADHEAWCVEEPITHSFTLADGMVTGNCESIPFDSLLAKGFNTRQTDVRPANSVNTAFQLVAVIFQLQSLQQFGGVSATHLDWTMVPYIRKSFMKHYIVRWLMQRDEFYNLDLEELFFESYEDEVGIIRNKFDDWVDENKNLFFEITGLKESDFYFDNNTLDKKLSQQAKFNTITETQQAAEGMYHNLNTLQSRSGNQLN